MSRLNWRRPEPQHAAGMPRLLRLNSGVFGPADPEPAFSQIGEYREGFHPQHQLLFVNTYLYTEFANEGGSIYLFMRQVGRHMFHLSAEGLVIGRDGIELRATVPENKGGGKITVLLRSIV